MTTSDSCEPIVLLGPSRRQRLTRLLKQAIEEWRHQWSGGNHGAVEVDVAEALCRRPTLSVGRALAFSTDAGEDRLLVISAPLEAQHELLGLPAPRSVVDGGGETASAVVGEALRALCLRLARAKDGIGANVTELSSEKLPQTWGQYGLTVIVKSVGERVLLRARLFPELLVAMLPCPSSKAAEPLPSRRNAIGVETVGVQAWLGEAEVSLGELANLQVGDVILLEATLNGAGHLALSDGRQLAQIRLGSAAGQRAISVTGKSTATPSRSV